MNRLSKQMERRIDPRRVSLIQALIAVSGLTCTVAWPAKVAAEMLAADVSMTPPAQPAKAVEEQPSALPGAVGDVGHVDEGAPVHQAHRGRSQRTDTPLDRRVALLAKELGLNPAQQTRVRVLLERQREDVSQLWSNTSLSPAIRVGRTQAISDHTADGIRALLDEEQRKKYIQPRQREASVGSVGASVEAWTARIPGP